MNGRKVPYSLIWWVKYTLIPEQLWFAVDNFYFSPRRDKDGDHEEILGQ